MFTLSLIVTIVMVLSDPIDGKCFESAQKICLTNLKETTSSLKAINRNRTELVPIRGIQGNPSKSGVRKTDLEKFQHVKRKVRSLGRQNGGVLQQIWYYGKKFAMYLIQKLLGTDVEAPRTRSNSRKDDIAGVINKKKAAKLVPLAMAAMLFKIKLMLAVILISLLVIKKTILITALVFPSTLAGIVKHSVKQLASIYHQNYAHQLQEEQSAHHHYSDSPSVQEFPSAFRRIWDVSPMSLYQVSS